VESNMGGRGGGREGKKGAYLKGDNLVDDQLGVKGWGVCDVCGWKGVGMSNRWKAEGHNQAALPLPSEACTPDKDEPCAPMVVV